MGSFSLVGDLVSQRYKKIIQIKCLFLSQTFAGEKIKGIIYNCLSFWKIKCNNGCIQGDTWVLDNCSVKGLKTRENTPAKEIYLVQNIRKQMSTSKVNYTVLIPNPLYANQEIG